MTTGIGTLSDLLPLPVPASRIYGVVVGLVTALDDNKGEQTKGVYQKLYRVKVKFPWLDDKAELWARVTTPMAGAGRGLYLPLQVKDEVAVMFEHGDPSHPIVIGALWNGADKPPGAVELPPKEGTVRYVLRSKSGHQVTLDDSNGAEKISIVDKSGKNHIVIDSEKNTVTITSEKDLSLLAKKGTITIEGKAIVIKGAVNINDGALEVTE